MKTTNRHRMLSMAEIKTMNRAAYLRGLEDAAKHLDSVAGNHSNPTVVQSYQRAAKEIRALAAKEGK